MEEEKNISNNGGYSMDDIVWHQHSNHLLLKIMELWPDKKRRIVDIGCGHNFYINTMNLLGYKGVGVDSVQYPGVFKSDITEPLFVLLAAVADDWEERFNVISLEVGEHIPLELSGAFLDNICRFGGDVILSWAIPGQAGIGHINCQSNAWVVDQMASRGYEFEPEKTLQLRIVVMECHCNWFQKTIMYFYKP